MKETKTENVQSIIAGAAGIYKRAEELKKFGIEINSVLISGANVSISVEKVIEKLAGALGAELTKSPRGYHLGFDFENVHFGQRVKGNYEDLY